MPHKWKAWLYYKDLHFHFILIFDGVVISSKIRDDSIFCLHVIPLFFFIAFIRWKKSYGTNYFSSVFYVEKLKKSQKTVFGYKKWLKFEINMTFENFGR